MGLLFGRSKNKPGHLTKGTKVEEYKLSFSTEETKAKLGNAKYLLDILKEAERGSRYAQMALGDYFYHGTKDSAPK